MRQLVAILATLLAVAAAAAIPLAGPAAADPGGPDTHYGRLVLLLDSSGSMSERAGDGRTKIADARTALGRVIGDLPAEAYVGLRVFGAKVFSKGRPGACSDTQSVVAPGTGNRVELRAAVGRYQPYGETPIPAALTAAARDLGGEGKRSIVLVSDGESTCGDPCPVARSIGNSGIDVQIDVVGLVTGRARQQLQCIAKSGHGTYYDAHDAGDLTDSIGRSSTRAAEPFTIEGAPVTGSAGTSSAPSLSAGTWLDRAPAQGQKRYYFVRRTVPGSTLHAGIATQPSGTNPASYTVKFLTADDDSCGDGWGFKFTNDATPILLAGALSLGDESHAECRSADGLLLEVANSTYGQADPPTPLQITITEEPPATDAASLPAEAGESDDVWQSLPATGAVTRTTFGTSFPTAPELGDGIHHTSIVPGEVQLYKVHLDWGQSLEAEARFAPFTDAAHSVGALLRVDVVSPDHAVVSDPLPSDPGGGVLSHNGDAVLIGQEAQLVRAMSFPVRYNNRTSYNDDIQATSIAGDYYVMVSLATDSTGASYIAPFDLAIKRTGVAGDGTPSYGGDGLVTSAPPSGSTTPSPSPTPSDGASAGPAGPSASPETPGDTDNPDNPGNPGNTASGDLRTTAGDTHGGGGSKVAVALSLGSLGAVLLGGAGWLLARRRVG